MIDPDKIMQCIALAQELKDIARKVFDDELKHVKAGSPTEMLISETHMSFIKTTDSFMTQAALLRKRYKGLQEGSNAD